ncbi:TPA: hypothetical protein ACGX6L_002184 [Listeria monocytogenes]
MKKGIVVLAGLTLVFGIFLTGCSSSKDDAAKTSNETKNSKSRSKQDENFVNDGTLVEVGQWTEKDEGKIKLKKITVSNTLFDLAPIKMTITDIKLLEFYDLSDSLKEFYKDATGKEQESYLGIQLFLKTVDTDSNKEIMFQGIDTIITNTKQQIDVTKESWTSFADAGVGSFKGQVETSGQIIVPYYGKAADLKTLTIISKKVWDENEPTLYHDSVKKEISF